MTGSGVFFFPCLFLKFVNREGKSLTNSTLDAVLLLIRMMEKMLLFVSSISCGCFSLVGPVGSLSLLKVEKKLEKLTKTFHSILNERKVIGRALCAVQTVLVQGLNSYFAPNH